MRRGFAIAIVYLLLILFPIGLGALIIPPIVGQAEDLADNVPDYVDDVEDFVNEQRDARRSRTRNTTSRPSSRTWPPMLPEKIADAAGALQDIGVGVVNSLFAAITILILSIFMVSGGPRWIERRFLRAPARPPSTRPRVERQRLTTLHRPAVATTSAARWCRRRSPGVTSFIVLTILGVPFAAPLAVLVFFFDLIPLVGATLAAVLVAVVTLFVNFPVALIVWVVYAIAYQQIENYVIQPQIQKRAVEVDPFVVLVAVLFGATLFGIIGALLAIPAAASIQIAIREWMAYRREILGEGVPGGRSQSPAGAEGGLKAYGWSAGGRKVAGSMPVRRPEYPADTAISEGEGDGISWSGR